MIDSSIQIVPHTLTSTEELHCLSDEVNNTTPDQLLSTALPHCDGGLSGLFPSQYTLQAFTPVDASSLYWLI